MRLSFFNKKHKPKLYLWYTKSTSTTGRNLADSLGIQCGYKIPPKNCDFVIGWGCRLKNPNISLSYLRDKIILNNPQAIKNNRDKVLSLKIMREKGVKVPDFCLDAYVDKQLEDKELEYPIIAR